MHDLQRKCKEIDDNFFLGGGRDTGDTDYNLLRPSFVIIIQTHTSNVDDPSSSKIKYQILQKQPILIGMSDWMENT